MAGPSSSRGIHACSIGVERECHERLLPGSLGAAVSTRPQAAASEADELSLILRGVRAHEDKIVVSEVKFKKPAATEIKRAELHVAQVWKRSTLARRYHNVLFEVLDLPVLA